MAYRMIQVETGGFGRSWCESFLQHNIRDGFIEVVAAVEVNPDAKLRLPDARTSSGSQIVGSGPA